MSSVIYCVHKYSDVILIVIRSRSGEVMKWWFHCWLQLVIRCEVSDWQSDRGTLWRRQEIHLSLFHHVIKISPASPGLCSYICQFWSKFCFYLKLFNLFCLLNKLLTRTMLLIVQLSSFHPIKPEVIVWLWEFTSLHQRCCSRGSSFSLAVRPHPSLANPPASANGLSVALAKIQTAVTWLTQLLPQPARLWKSSRDPLR